MTKQCCKSKKIEVICEDIYLDATFYSNTIYIIIGEVRVLSGVVLNVEENTEIYITNGAFMNNNGELVRSKLIFETGSKLFGTIINFRACDNNYIPVQEANNGGLYFLGSSSNAEKDFVSSSFSTKISNFNANYIFLSYLGGKDEPIIKNSIKRNKFYNIKNLENTVNIENQYINQDLDDYDAISIIGVNNNEWGIKNVYSEYSGDDGFDVTNSSIELDSVVVKLPNEDGLNITSSRVNILQNLTVNMTITEVFDRDIFDLETNDGPSFIRLSPDCTVKIDGIFGDQLTLVSDDLPQPEGDKPYIFEGILKNCQTYIYSGQFQL